VTSSLLVRAAVVQAAATLFDAARSLLTAEQWITRAARRAVRRKLQPAGSERLIWSGSTLRVFDPVAYIDGLEDPRRAFTNICGRLVQHGFDDETRRAVIGRNLYRALQSVWVGP
jgi:microsomal dipeptidase-like Zn-dependent dipeptidase